VAHRVPACRNQNIVPTVDLETGPGNEGSRVSFPLTEKPATNPLMKADAFSFQLNYVIKLLYSLAELFQYF